MFSESISCTPPLPPGTVLVELKDAEAKSGTSSAPGWASKWVAMAVAAQAQSALAMPCVLNSGTFSTVGW